MLGQLLALGAEVVLRSSSGSRSVPIERFLLGPFESDTGPDEILTEIRIPVPAPGTGYCYSKLKRKIGDFATAGNWFTKVTLLEPANVRGFLALGATAFNSGDLDAAEVAWREALDIDGKNVEAHYDLGFLYFNRQPPDMAKVQEHWQRVVELDPESEVAQTVKAHLGAIASMVPASPAPSERNRSAICWRSLIMRW